MNLEILNTEFVRVRIVDDYESFIWTDRYAAYGDFELYFPMMPNLFNDIKIGYYLVLDQSKYTMIIEKIEIKSDVENGDHIVVSGRSLESILSRRIVWNQTIVQGKLQTAVKKIINDSIINPGNSLIKRKIENFKFIETTDSRITSLKIEPTQFTGDNVYEVVKKLLEDFDIGFSIILNENNEFEFSLYTGEDRSYNQTDKPYVIFSPEFENIIESDYYEDHTRYCNVTLVAGEGEGKSRRTAIAGDNNVSGLNRRELFTDARDISSNSEGYSETENEGGGVTSDIDSNGDMNDEEYTAALIERGKEKLKEVDVEKVFEGQVDASILYKYGEDFFIGDIVEFENAYANHVRVRVDEYIYSISEEGEKHYPTFRVLEEEDIDDE